MDHFEQINETSYLSVQNAPVYRKIMRCFYREYEKMHFQLYKEDIFRLLKEDGAFEMYSMEQLVLDLESLVKWKNLTPIQDPGKVYTIADYKNKQYRNPNQPSLAQQLFPFRSYHFSPSPLCPCNS